MVAACVLGACVPARRTGGEVFGRSSNSGSEAPALPSGARRVAEPEEIPSLEGPPIVDGASSSLTDADEVAALELPSGRVVAVPFALLARTPIVNLLAESTALSVVLDASSGAVAAYVSPAKGLGATGVVLSESFVVHDRGAASLHLALTGEVVGSDGEARALTSWPLDVCPWGYVRALHPGASVVAGELDRERAAQVRGGVGSAALVEGVPAAAWIVGFRAGGAMHAHQVTTLAGVSSIVAGGEPVLLVAVPGGAIVRARRVGARTFTFSAAGDHLVDAETGSEWTLDGRAYEGPSSGLRLPRVEFERRARWFAWKAVFESSSVDEVSAGR